jgi:hypothetical protein
MIHVENGDSCLPELKEKKNYDSVNFRVERKVIEGENLQNRD